MICARRIAFTSRSSRSSIACPSPSTAKCARARWRSTCLLSVCDVQAYISRIMDIIKNLDKQKVDIQKVRAWLYPLTIEHFLSARFWSMSSACRRTSTPSRRPPSAASPSQMKSSIRCCHCCRPCLFPVAHSRLDCSPGRPPRRRRTRSRTRRTKTSFPCEKCALRFGAGCCSFAFLV